MRLFEILILVLNFLTLFSLPIQVRPRWSGFLPALAVVLIPIHASVEGYRWQMIPAYALTGILFLLGLGRMRRPPASPSRRLVWTFLGSSLGLLWLVGATALPVLFPVPRLPTPTGPYAVGTVSYHWTDTSRAEIYTDDPNDVRELMVQIWYPAGSPTPGARLGAWMQRLDVAGPAIARYLHLPSFFLDHAALVRTHSFPDAPLNDVETRYPVVIYSHGWNGFRNVNTNQSEELASHGYVVAAVDHTYGAMVTVFPDGRVALNNPAALPEGVPDDEYQRASETLEATYAADVRFVLDQMAQLDAGALDDRFVGGLDLERVGLFGHSTGGGAVVIACSQDPRCKAGAGLDAWLGPVPAGVLATSLAQPFLFMRSEVWASAKNDALLDRLYGELKGEGYKITILGTRHYDFTMLPLLTPLAPALKLKGPLEGGRTLKVIDDYLVAFFDKYLREEAEPLLDGPSGAYPEVIFEKNGK